MGILATIRMIGKSQRGNIPVESGNSLGTEAALAFSTTTTFGSRDGGMSPCRCRSGIPSSETPTQPKGIGADEVFGASAWVRPSVLMAACGT
jgi:hypothetical protein